MGQMPVVDGKYKLGLNPGQEIILDTANKMADKNVVVSNNGLDYYEHNIVIDTNSSSSSGYRFSFTLKIPSSTKITSLGGVINAIQTYYNNGSGLIYGMIPASGNDKTNNYNKSRQIIGIFNTGYSNYLGLVYVNYSSNSISSYDSTQITSANKVQDLCYKITYANKLMYEHNIVGILTSTSSSSTYPGCAFGIKLILESSQKITLKTNNDTQNTNNFLFSLESYGYTNSNTGAIVNGLYKSGSVSINPVFQLYASGGSEGNRTLYLSYVNATSYTSSVYSQGSITASKLSSYPIKFWEDIVREIYV